MRTKYNRIGSNYNLTRKADPYLVSQLLCHLQPNKDGLYLDIGCGTGNYTNSLCEKGFSFIGVDPSKRMLEKARSKNPSIMWLLGNAEKIELPDQCVEGIIASLTIHHWSHLPKAFSELDRVLKDSGRIVIFTSTPKQMEGYWLNHYFPKMLRDSIIQMPSLEKIQDVMATTGLKIIETINYDIKPDLQDQFLYCGKEHAELYFDEHIRHGISSFSALANLDEVDNGLKQLRQDITTRAVEEIMKSYTNDGGDYLYIVAEKV